MSLGQSKLAKVMVRCSLWPIMACQRECEVEGEEKIFWEIFVVEENGRKEKDILGKHVVVEKGKNKGNGKRKRNYKREDIFSNLKNGNIENTDS